MRLLRINGKDVDLDDKTAIGVDYQAYDIKQPGVRKVKITNTFTVPATAANRAIFGHAENPQSLSKVIYNHNTLDYWVDNEKLIDDARVRVEGIADRISLFVFQKPDVWDLIKKVLWPEFVEEFITYLHNEKGLPSKAAPFTGELVDFLIPYRNASEGVKLPFYFGNLYNYDPAGGENFLEDPTNICLRYDDGVSKFANGGHFCVYCKTIFEFIEWKYDVDFLTGGSQVVGNLWDDVIAKALYIPIRDLTPRFSFTGATVTGYYFEYNSNSKYLPLKDQKDKAGKKLYDFVNSFFQHLNVIQDEIILNNKKAIRLSRFDDIENLADVIDWSGNYSGKQKFKPNIKGYEQENIIKFKDIYEEGDELSNSKILTSEDKNLDASTSLFTIDAYVNSFLGVTGGVVPDLSPKEAFKTFSFLLDSGLSGDAITMTYQESGIERTATMQLHKSGLYNLSSEYNFLDKILDYPRFYEVERWLTVADIKDLQFFRQYFIKELNGSYFLNKISGFNPQKSNKPTKLELIKVSNKTPITPPDLNYWTDGVKNGFVDGDGDYWV